MKKQRKKIFFTSGLLIMSLTALYFYAPYFVVEIKNPLIISAKNFIAHKNIVQQPPEKYYKDEIFSFDTNDHLKISGIIHYTNFPCKGNIILLHGIRSSKESFLPVLNFIAKNGFNSVAIDLRAHGTSEGEYCTYGFKEKDDISKLIDYLSNEKKFKNFGIWGHSLGGAIAIQSLATDKRLQFGIIESTYADFKQISKDYGEYYLGINPDFINENILERSAEIAGFDLSEINPVDYCKNVSQPVLFMHGTKDKKIKLDYNLKNFEKVSSLNKKFIPVKNAGHNDLWQIGGKELLNKISKFLQDINHIDVATAK